MVRLASIVRWIEKNIDHFCVDLFLFFKDKLPALAEANDLVQKDKYSALPGANDVPQGEVFRMS